MLITEAVPVFLQYLQFEKRFAEHTLIAYRGDLEQFSGFLLSQFSITLLPDVASFHVRTWMATLKDEGISSRSINRKLSALKSFFKHFLRIGAISASPLATITGPKPGKKLPVWIEPSKMDQILDKGIYPDNWEGLNARLAITILYEAGLRRSELVNLQESQVDFHNKSIRVLGKGKKERILPVRPGLLDEIKQYMDLKVNTGKGGTSKILLVKENDQPITSAWVYGVVKQYAGLVTTQEKKSPHVLRHSFATHLTNAGADLNAVKELLGHSSLAATQVYTHNSIEKLKNIHGKAHPRG